MKTLKISEAQTVLGFSYNKTRDSLAKRGILRLNPKPCVLEEDLKVYCEELGLSWRGPSYVASTPKHVPDKWVTFEKLLPHLPLVCGNLFTSDALQAAINRGHWQKDYREEVPWYNLRDFKDALHWASPEEKKWRAAADSLAKHLFGEKPPEGPILETLIKAHALATAFYSTLFNQRTGIIVTMPEEVTELRQKVADAPWDLVKEYLP